MYTSPITLPLASNARRIAHAKHGAGGSRRGRQAGRSWVYRAAEEGRIPHLRLGGARGPLRFSPSAIDRFEAQARRPGSS